MTQLTQEFVDSCPVEKGFRMRGLEMTRLEVFVDAAFAFAVTMLVISFDEIPRNYDEIITAIKGIPAFVAAVAQLVWIWHTHNRWSRRFGLDTGYTVLISTALLVVVLIYIYPMRIMAAGMFSWLTQEYLPANFRLDSLDQLGVMFVFLGIGFAALSLVFAEMYRYALSKKEELLLNAHEILETRIFAVSWLGASVTGLLCVVLATVLPDEMLPFSGFAFTLLAVWFPLNRYLMNRRANKA